MPDRLPQAARKLGVSQATLRRWVRDGAPCVVLGGAGRGRGSVVDVESIRQWRAGRLGAGSRDLLPQIATALSDVLRRDGGDGRPAHLRLGIQPNAAAELLHAAYLRIAREVAPETDHE